MARVPEILGPIGITHAVLDHGISPSDLEHNRDRKRIEILKDHARVHNENLHGIAGDPPHTHPITVFNFLKK